MNKIKVSAVPVWPIKTSEGKHTKPVDCVNNNGPLNDFPQVSKTGYLIIVLVMAKSKQGEKIFTKEKTYPMNI